MRKGFLKVTLTVIVAVFSAIITACSGGDGGGGSSASLLVAYDGKTTQSDISTATVTDGLQSVNTFIPICTTTSAPAKAVSGSGEQARERSTP